MILGLRRVVTEQVDSAKVLMTEWKNGWIKVRKEIY